jgi:hypothetical protein
LSLEVLDYFKGLADETGLPYQKLTDLYFLGLVAQILHVGPKRKNPIQAAAYSDTLSEFPHSPISGQRGFGVWLLWFPFYDLIHL